jgi:hypothetical protein
MDTTASETIVYYVCHLRSPWVEITRAHAHGLLRQGFKELECTRGRGERQYGNDQGSFLVIEYVPYYYKGTSMDRKP